MSKNLKIKKEISITGKVFGSKKIERSIPETSSITTYGGSLSFQTSAILGERNKEIMEIITAKKSIKITIIRPLLRDNKIKHTTNEAKVP